MGLVNLFYESALFKKKRLLEQKSKLSKLVKLK